ncbi:MULTISPECIES: HigA family addiction module antitoxin [Hyphomicrobiales]|uniref:HigA family addiction module antitoxin n=1 Tax=Hyphomicrobiales TaxID=356 RepID=UPI0025BE9076|nr:MULTISPECIES: HigA family addiction module antitoxin [Hyphomicrobiales]MBX3559895.1 HigA family addiction module antidote protein [Chelatococcus sp.]MCO5154768.1 HigA family addiction module antitoxin [Shinella sp.]
MNDDDAGMRLEKPPHPGGFVKAEVIEPLNLSVTDAAEVLGITRAALSTFLNGRSNLSPEMALRIEKAFGVPMDTLMRMQCSYDIAEARSKEDGIGVKRYVPKAKSRVQPGLFEG